MDMHLCVSPVGAERCQNIISSQKIFCKTHASKFMPLYFKYKRLEKRIQTKPTDIYALFKNYKYLNQAYDKRCQFRNQAIVAEEWDAGHDLRIKIILKRIEKTMKQIKSYYDEFKNKKEDSKEVEPEKAKIKDTTLNLTKEYNEVVELNQKIQQKEESFAQIIQKAKLRNQKNLKKLKQDYIEESKELQNQMEVNYKQNFLLFIFNLRKMLKTYKNNSSYSLITCTFTIRNDLDDFLIKLRFLKHWIDDFMIYEDNKEFYYQAHKIYNPTVPFIAFNYAKILNTKMLFYYEVNQSKEKCVVFGKNGIEIVPMNPRFKVKCLFISNPFDDISKAIILNLFNQNEEFKHFIAKNYVTSFPLDKTEDYSKYWNINLFSHAEYMESNLVKAKRIDYLIDLNKKDRYIRMFKAWIDCSKLCLKNSDLLRNICFRKAKF